MGWVALTVRFKIADKVGGTGNLSTWWRGPK